MARNDDTDLIISAPQAEDFPGWRRLYDGYAEFYSVPMNDDIAGNLWTWLTDTDHEVQGLIARFRDGAVVGFAHYRRMPSPLRGTYVGFLDDLFVDPASRGKDIGRALFSRLRQECRNNGWPLMRWITRDNNYRARGLYDQVSTRTDWVTYQMDI